MRVSILPDGREEVSIPRHLPLGPMEGRGKIGQIYGICADGDRVPSHVKVESRRIANAAAVYEWVSVVVYMGGT